MPVKCNVSVNYSETQLVCTFVVVPRVGEDVFIPEVGNAMMYQVVRVSHWAKEANPEVDGPTVDIFVSSNPHATRT